MSNTTEMSIETGALFGALAAAQAELGPVAKTSKAKIGDKYSYTYADLASVLGAVLPTLSKHGLAIVQTTGEAEGGVAVITTLGHASGQWMRGLLVMRCSGADPKAVGSAITYGRRYAISAIIGIASEEDDDGASAGRREPPKRREEEHRPAPTRPTPGPREVRKHNAEALHPIREGAPSPFERAKAEFPELGPDYTLDPSDYGAAYTENQKAYDHADIRLADAHTWQEHLERIVRAGGKALWKKLTSRERALALWANELRTARKAADEAAYAMALEDAARLGIDIKKAHELMPDPKRRALENYTVAELGTLAAARNAELEHLSEKSPTGPPKGTQGPAQKAAKRLREARPEPLPGQEDATRKLGYALTNECGRVPSEQRRGWCLRLLALARFEDTHHLPNATEPSILLGHWLAEPSAIKVLHGCLDDLDNEMRGAADGAAA